MANTGDKPKKGTYKAPQFPHLPAEKARKLKQAWLAKQKIKNSYRAQKRARKLDIISSDRPPDSGWSGRFKADDGQANEDNEDTSEIPSDSTPTKPIPIPTPSTSTSPIHRKFAPSAASNPSQTISRPSSSTKPKQPHPMRRNRKLKSDNRSPVSGSGSGNIANKAQDDKSMEEPSLRELVRDAYSRSSLHKFKSDPLHRRHQAERSTKEKGRGAATSGSGGTKRGQPDMRKRMGALLAQIKSVTA